MDEIQFAQKNGKMLSTSEMNEYEYSKEVYNRWKYHPVIPFFLTKDQALQAIANKK